MRAVTCLVFLSGAYPLWVAWRANRRTSLAHAVGWAVAAWAAWGGLLVVAAGSGPTADTATPSYLALCLTGCAAVAVLGARRPGVGAWNFVLLGLLAVMLLPLAENLFVAGHALDPLRVVFLAATVAVGVVNYLPTRLAPAALLVGGACALELLRLAGQGDGEPALSGLLAGLAPWAALAGWRRRPAPPSEFDLIWLDFRDRFGFLWGQRTREQFNRSAANAGWPVVLRWQGLRLRPGTSLPGPAVQTAIVATLRGLLKRFGEEDLAKG
jgi:hypothetical protein